jgi:hypothetical protein
MRRPIFNEISLPIIVGTTVWFFGPGALLTYVIAADWGHLDPSHAATPPVWQPLLVLLFAAVSFAVAVEALSLFAAWYRSRIIIRLGPFVAGAWIGALHGLIAGALQLDTPHLFSTDPTVLIIAGAICGLIGTAATSGIAALVRRAIRRPHGSHSLNALHNQSPPRGAAGGPKPPHLYGC